MDTKTFSPLARQICILSGILSTIFSCGLGLGLFSVINDNNVVKEDNWQIHDNALSSIEIASEIAFVPSIVIIPYIMQKKGRRKANLATILPLVLAWALVLFNNVTLLVVINILYTIAIGGSVAISSITIAELCSTKYRATLLMLQPVMFSLGFLISHLFGIYTLLTIIPYIGIVSASYALLVTYYWLESPYWLISQGLIEKCMENFYWIRGDDEEAKKEIDALLRIYKAKMQVDALKPIFKSNLRDRSIEYMKTLWTIDFLRPLFMMILLFSFVVVAAQSLSVSFSSSFFNLSNGKYIGTVFLDVITVLCSVIACILLRLGRRKSLFMITGLISICFLVLEVLYLLLQSLGILSPDYMWLYVTFGTLFAVFMFLGTLSLPFSLLGEIFPITFKEIGSSLTCAYLWAFGNTVIKLAAFLSAAIGTYSMTCIFIILMVVILIILIKYLPETSDKSLIEIEEFKLISSNQPNLYDSVKTNDDHAESFDKLKLLIEYA